jgi:hypothetical protein
MIRIEKITKVIIGILMKTNLKSKYRKDLKCIYEPFDEK